MRTVQDVLNLRNGKNINAEVFFSRTENEIFADRRTLEEAAQRNEKTLVCAICRQALKIRGNRDGRHSIHFAHLYDSGDCPIKTGKKYSADEILRMKYNGAKESDLHIQLKNAIADTIRRDNRFSNIDVDKTFRTEGLLKEWKRPDVAAVFDGKRIVFEVQLSTTFLSVIVQRELFYLRNNTFIMWIFNEFETDIDAQRFTEKDIIYSNNHNAFLVNDETLMLSQEAGKFMLYCYYQRPLPDERLVWEKNLISFDDITFDHQTYKVYYFDTNREREQLKAEALRQQSQDFEKFWLNRQNLDYEEKRDGLLKFQAILKNKNIIFDCYDDSLAKILDALFTLKYKRMIGYDFKNYISLANNILEYRKPYGELFLRALKHFKIARTVLVEDKKGTFLKKVDNLRSQQIQENETYDSLFKLLFPGLIDVKNFVAPSSAQVPLFQ
jgi:competence CoiA-like predicted nuclease